MAFLRVLLGVLIAMMVIVVAIPAVVLIDLVSGGTGLGLCPTGLGTCTTSAFTIAELLALLAVALGLLGAAAAVCARALRRSAAKRSMGLG